MTPVKVGRVGGVGFLHRAVVASTVAAAALLSAPLAEAQNATICDGPTYFQWTQSTAVTGTGSTAASDTAFNPNAGMSFNYFSVGTNLVSLNNAGGGPKPGFPISPFGTTIQNYLTPVKLANGSEYIFVAAQDGRLWRIDPTSPGTQFWVDTRRSMSNANPAPLTSVGDPVCGADQLLATPAVQLKQFSNGTFTGTTGIDDLVFVISNNQCGDTTHNTIKAYNASTLVRRWVFNNSTSNGTAAPRDMDRGVEGCVISYTGNTLYCGSKLDNPAGTQQSLWAINTITGGLRWSFNAGSIQNRPILRNGPDGLRVYVVNYDGAIQAYSPNVDPANPLQGLPLWTTPLQVPFKVQSPPFIYGDPSSTKNSLVLVDLAGNVRSFQDNGANAIAGAAQAPAGTLLTMPLCPGGTLCYLSTPVMGFGLSVPKAFLARNDGRVQQLSNTLSREGAMNINPDPLNNTNVYGVSLDVNSTSSTCSDRLMAVAKGSGGTGAVVRVNLNTDSTCKGICSDAPPFGSNNCNPMGNAVVCGDGDTQPFRYCVLGQDPCNKAATAGSTWNPCQAPLRCSPKPACCAMGTCPVGFACASGTNNCNYYKDGLYQVPDNTVCDAKVPATIIVSTNCTTSLPVPTLQACVGTDGSTTGTGSNRCLYDSDCVAANPARPVCSGTGAQMAGGVGGPILNGMCCPAGTACHFTSTSTGVCWGNFGDGSKSNNVCRNGTCAVDAYSQCDCTTAGDKACATGTTCCGAAGCVNLQTNLKNCGKCGQDCSLIGESCFGGRCCPSATTGACSDLLACSPKEGDSCSSTCCSGMCVGSVCQ